jgi:hypothetical protein
MKKMSESAGGNSAIIDSSTPAACEAQAELNEWTPSDSASGQPKEALGSTLDVSEDEIEDDESDSLEIDFIDEDAFEAQLALDALNKEDGDFYIPLQDTLAERLRHDPTGSFPVSAYSLYSHDTWVLFKDEFGVVTNFIFNHSNEHKKAIHKAIAWYCLPENAPFQTTRSYVTARTNIRGFNIATRYVLEPNFLSGDPESLQLITARMLDSALDGLKEGKIRNLYALFKLLKLWSTLSAQNLIPVRYQLNVSLEQINTPERRHEVLQLFQGRVSGWIPFNESELGKLLDYGCFWTDKALGCIDEAKKFIVEHELYAYHKKCVTRGKPDLALEKKLNIEIDGRTVLSTNKKDEIVINDGRPERSVSYWWAKSYSDGVDHVRNAVFILVALLTGLRISEIKLLQFHDVYADPDNNEHYVMRINRHKTAKDPNFGEIDEIPIPRFLALSILGLKSLREITISSDNPYVFRSGKSFGRANANQPPSNRSIAKIISEIERLTGVDQIHVHRFRKTIAEILVNRNERNINIIRILFGHKSYTMTLRYIGRNPYLVHTVATAIEQNYTAEFSDLITSIQHGTSSGPGANRLRERINAHKGAFEGKQLRLTILTYVTHLLSSGQPLFIHRTAVGSFCLSTQTYSSPDLPPCLSHRKHIVTGMLPDPSNCDPSCEHAIIVQKAKTALEDNVKFYNNILEKGGSHLSEKSRKMILEKISANTKHLDTSDLQPKVISAIEVTSEQ